MPWTRVGDNAATYPKLMQTAGQRGADERTVNEVAGWLLRCAFQAAAHMTDYRIDMGTAWMLGGPRTEELIRLTTRAGLLTKVDVDGVKMLKLVEDVEFVHIRLRKEVEWERQQRQDTRDPRLKAPVLRRDGDNCRWCGIGVHWRGKTTPRTGTIDHLAPGQPGTVDTMVVACKRCNSARQDNPQWDDDHELRQAPAQPNYGAITAAYLTEHGHPTEPNYGSDARHGAGTAPQQGVRPAAASPARSVAPQSAPHSESSTDSTRGAGSGRDGSGLLWSGPDGSGLHPTTPPHLEDQPTPRTSPPQPRTNPRRRGRRGARGGQQR